MQTMDDKTLVLIHTGRCAPEGLNKLELSQKLGPSVEIQEFSDLETMSQALNDGTSAVAVAFIPDSDGMMDVFEFLSSTRPKIKKGLARILVINWVENEKLAKRLKDKGCSDVLGFGIASGELARRLSIEIEELQASKKLDDPQQEKQPKTGCIEWLSPLLEESDCWLVDDQGDIKCVLGRWLVELIGPGPGAGSWKLMSEQSGGDDLDLWEWKPRNVRDNPFADANGKWIFQGRQPEFIWKFNRWRMVSKNPSLIYYPNSGDPVFRFKLNSRSNLEICRNSSTAQEKLPLIIESLENSQRFKPTDLPNADWDIQDLKDATGKGWEVDDAAPVTEKPDTENQIQREPLDPRWKVGADAFASFEIGITIQWPGEASPLTNDEVCLLEIGDADLLIEVPSRELSPGQEAKFGMRITDAAGKTASLSSPITVKEIVISEEGRMIFKASVDEKNAKMYRRIMKTVSERQNEILSFFNEMKGL